MCFLFFIELGLIPFRTVIQFLRLHQVSALHVRGSQPVMKWLCVAYDGTCMFDRVLIFYLPPVFMVLGFITIRTVLCRERRAGAVKL